MFLHRPSTKTFSTYNCQGYQYVCVCFLDGQVLHARFDNMPRINNNILHCWISNILVRISTTMVNLTDFAE